MLCLCIANLRIATAGLQWQCFCLVHKHGHPLTLQRVHGGVSLEDGACGDDSDCIVALTPGRLGNVAAGFEVVDDLGMLLDSMAYALRDSLYCACHIQPGAWHCMLPAHDVRSCVEHLRL